MLANIKITNFKRIKSLDVSVERGLNIIKGRNSTGKSTLVQAIVFALYGQAAVPGQRKHIPTKGAKGCEVVLSLEDGHTITRTLSNCSVELDGKQVASGNKACTSYLTDLLKLDLTGFGIFHWAPQGETSALLTLGALELQRKVEHFCGIASLDDTIKNASGDVRAMNAVYDSISVGDIPELKAEADRLSANLEAANVYTLGIATIVKLEEKKSEVAYSKWQEALDHNRQVDKRKLAMAGAVAAAEGEIKHLDRLRKKLRETNPPGENALKSLKDKTERLRSDLEGWAAHNLAIQVAKDEQVRLLKRLDKLQLQNTQAEATMDTKAELEAKLELLEPEYEACRETVANQKQLYEGLAVQVKVAKDAVENGVCPTCHRAYDDAEGIEEWVEKYESLQKGYALAKARKKNAEDALNKVFASRYSVKEGLKNLPSVEPVTTQIYETEEQLEKVSLQAEGEMKDLDKPRREMKKQQQAAEVMGLAAAEYEYLSKQIEKAKAEVESANALIAKLPTAGKELPLNKFSSEVEQCRGKIKAAHKLHEEAKEQYYMFQTRASSAVEKYEQAVAAEKRKAEQFVHITHATELIKYLTGSRVRFLETVWKAILDNASNFCRVATKNWVEDGQSRTIVEIIRREGNFFFVEGGVELPVSSASGAQRAFIGVGIRLGLSLALRGTHSLLILDEPTAEMDADNANALAGVLLGLPGQVLMVTHRPYEEMSANQVIRLGE